MNGLLKALASAVFGRIGSGSFKFSQDDVAKIARGAFWAGLAAAAAYAVNAAGGLDYGPSTPVVVAGLAWLGNAIQTWVSDSSKK